MIRFIAFLRGVNVSGHRIIKMEDLRKIFESMKLHNVKTYIQSGNVIFDSPEKNSNSLTDKIENHLHKSLVYEVAVMLRSVQEIEKIIKQNPYKKEKINKNLMLYLTFLSQKPSDDSKKLLLTLSDDIATYEIIDREVYTLYMRSNAKHPFSNNFVEKKLKVSATTRNWNVVNKISELANKQE